MAITKLPRNAIADDAINADKIEDGTIQATEITGTVSAVKLNDTLDISSKTVTLPNTSVTNDMLANTTIANAKLSNSSFTVRGTSRALGVSFSLGVDVDWQSVVTGDTTMVAGQGYFVNTTSGAVTMTLPSSASTGDTIAIKDYAGTFGSNAVTIARNSHKIQGLDNNSSIGTNRASVILVYADATKGWLYTDEHNVADLQQSTFVAATGGTVATSGDFKIHTFTGDGCFVVSTTGVGPAGGPATVDYLVIGGGGGGRGNAAYYGAGSGGGAGGFRESESGNTGSWSQSPLAATGCGQGISVTAGTTYPITVGGGGGNYTAGSPSVFSTITSAGGGRGGKCSGAGGAGGSGGGGGGHPGGSGAGGAGNTPPVSPPQGNNGGAGSGSANYGGGGGGGAGTAGSNASGGTAGNGGNGITTSFTGSPVTRAGGGGSGYYAAGGGGSASSGGPGGGGNGSAGTPAGTAAAGNGTANTGSGGGGANTPAEGPKAGSGGKGLVVVRYKFQ